MGHGDQLQPFARGLEHGVGRIVQGDEGFDPAGGAGRLDVGRAFGQGGRIFGCGSTPTLLFAVQGVAGHDAAHDVGDLIGAVLRQMDVEGGAVLGLHQMFGLDGRAVGRRHHQAGHPHGGVVGDEDPVGHAGVESDPGVGARQAGRGRRHPGAVRLGGQGRSQGGGEGQKRDSLFHGSVPQRETVTRTAPSSVEPEASAVLAPPQRKGTRTTSRPPSSRAASTTRLYWPG